MYRFSAVGQPLPFPAQPTSKKRITQNQGKGKTLQ
jgi:hypothetical protein